MNISEKTFLWQEQRGLMIFRIQTTDPRIAERMSRRKRFKLTAKGINCKIWIYIAEFYSPQKARQALAQLTGRKVKKDTAEEVFFA